MGLRTGLGIRYHRVANFPRYQGASHLSFFFLSLKLHDKRRNYTLSSRSNRQNNSNLFTHVLITLLSLLQLLGFYYTNNAH